MLWGKGNNIPFSHGAAWLLQNAAVAACLSLLTWAAGSSELSCFAGEGGKLLGWEEEFYSLF